MHNICEGSSHLFLKLKSLCSQPSYCLFTIFTCIRTHETHIKYKARYLFNIAVTAVRKISTPIDKTVVMIVEDMQAMRMMVKTTLKHMGFRHFAECPNGYEASKRLRLMNVDLIICDFDMPEKNGLELLKEVRAEERTKNKPFIMLTANSSANLIHECISAGVDSYMVKPFQPLALCKKVNSLLLTPVENIA